MELRISNFYTSADLRKLTKEFLVQTLCSEDESPPLLFLTIVSRYPICQI